MARLISNILSYSVPNPKLGKTRMRATLFLSWFIVLGLVSTWSGSRDAAAQVSPGAAREASREADAATIQSLVEAARDQGYRVVLVPPENTETPVPPSENIL